MSQLVAKKAFLAGMICRTQGWYTHHASTDVPGPGLQWRFWTGADIHTRARDWLGVGTMLRRTPLDDAISDSQDAIGDQTHELLYEVTFTWNGCVARADAIRRAGIEWDLIEIKSGKSPEEDEKIKAEYVDDLAYTHMVAFGAGLKVARALLVLVNRDFRLRGDAALFRAIDITNEVTARAAVFATMAGDIAAAAAGDARPTPEMILACKDCDWFETDCVGVGIPDPLFVIPRISAKKFDALKIYQRISALPVDADLTDIQRGIVDVIQSGRARVSRDGLQILDGMQWPVRYLDFEAVTPPVPWFEDSPPYEAVPFQYSLHQLDAPDAELVHREYLAPVDGDWRRDMLATLLRDLGDSGSIVVYSGYEKGRLRALATTFPSFADQINAVIERLFDLEHVFKHGYQHPGFGGRTSIKKVLPVMVPELSYQRLAVNNGDDALGVFGLMRVGVTDEEVVPRQRELLLEYCKLDTYAMVRLHAATEAIRMGDGAFDG